MNGCPSLDPWVRISYPKHAIGKYLWGEPQWTTTPSGRRPLPRLFALRHGMTGEAVVVGAGLTGQGGYQALKLAALRRYPGCRATAERSTEDSTPDDRMPCKVLK